MTPLRTLWRRADLAGLCRAVAAFVALLVAVGERGGRSG